MEAIHDNDGSDSIENGRTVLHPEAGPGTVVKQGNPGNVYVNFRAKAAEMTYVDVPSLDAMPTLLHDVDVNERPEFPMAHDRDDESTLHTGEVIIDLDLAEGVEYDVDDDGGGGIIIQYWMEEER